jgi:Tfp pilus assembly protein PilO
MQLGLKTFVFLLLLVGMLVMSYPMLFKPLNEHEAQLIEDTRDKREKLARLEQATAEVKDLQQEIDKLKKAIGFFESKLPEEKEMDKVLREIWQQAEKYGMHVKSVRNQQVVAGQSYSEQPIRMMITGPFDGFYKFMRSVEQMPRITRVGDMKVEADDKNSGAINADLILSIYFEQVEPKQAA